MRSHYWPELLGLSRRYLDTFTHAWAHRRELTPLAFEPCEAEFLPAALEIQATPVSPAGRWVARILIAFVLCVFAWSILARIDIVVTAEGKLVPDGYTKVIASVDTANVLAVHVEDGQTVKAGDVLIELDSRQIDSERDRALADWQNARLQSARARALIVSLDRREKPQLPEIREVPLQRWRETRDHLHDQWGDFSAKLARLNGDVERYKEELPLAKRRAADLADLAATGDASKHELLQAEQARIELARQLDDASAQRASLITETRKDAQDDLDVAERTLAESKQDEQRASVHSALLRLVAPVDGTVQELTVHTIGGVVSAVQPLMQIVPIQRQVKVEALLENKDVGFVQEGQPASVKIDAFEYTKYGTVSARVLHISRDAIHDEKRGLLYSAIIELDRSDLFVDGHLVTLEPGLSGSVEIKTGSRRVIEYLLSPLIRQGRESLRER